MSIILTAVEVVGGMAGMAWVCHRIEQVMLARNGYDTRDFFRPIAGPTARSPVAPVPRVVPWTETQAKLAAQSFIDNPLAFWLDPNLWGDDPHWRERMFPKKGWVDPHPPIDNPAKDRAEWAGRVDPAKEAEAEAVMRRHGIMVPKQHFRMVMSPGYSIGDEPRPDCPKCDASFPRLDVPLNHDGSEWANEDAYFTCGVCRHQWDRTPKSKRKGWKARLAMRDEYTNEMPAPPWTGGPRKPKGTSK